MGWGRMGLYNVSLILRKINLIFFIKSSKNIELIQGSMYLPFVPQCFPENPGGQVQMPSLQLPPFLHGFGIQASS